MHPYSTEVAYMERYVHCFCGFYGGCNADVNGKSFQKESCMINVAVSTTKRRLHTENVRASNICWRLLRVKHLRVFFLRELENVENYCYSYSST